jgi:hypothetical protein
MAYIKQNTNYFPQQKPLFLAQTRAKITKYEKATSLE